MTNPDMGTRITLRMAQLGVSVTGLAAEIGVSASTVSGWRAGADLRASHLMGLCRALRCSADWILFGERVGQDALLIGYFHQLQPPHQAALMEYLKTLANSTI